MLRWLRAFAQPTTYLGLAMIAVVWGGVLLLASQQRERAYTDALRQGSNLTHVFEEYIARVIKGTDSQLLILRELHSHNPHDFELARWVKDAKFRDNLAVNFAIIGPDGRIALRSEGAMASTANVADREHFRVHVNSTTDELYISTPVIGRVSGRSNIQLTRRLTAPDGSFNGIVLASLDILQLKKFYNAVDVGAGGTISLIGFDGIIRVRSGHDPAVRAMTGVSIARSPMFKLYRQSPTGSFWNSSSPAGELEGVRRLITYRVIEGLPLLAVVGLADSDIFQQANLQGRRYYQIAFLLTAFVLIAVGFGALRQMKLAAATAELERSNLSLEQANSRFDAALDNMTHGLCMFDAKKQLVVCNDRYANMYSLPPELLKVGTPHQTIMAHRVMNGLLPGSSSAGAVAEQLSILCEVPSDKVSNRIDQHADGRLIRVTRQPMKEGGWVATHEDITAQKQAEAQIVHLARHDALTGLANRTVLLEKMDEALARLRRFGEEFTIFILDLDLFKVVNDSLGHPVGDALLRAVARRLLACTRETDTVARLGGDEFAILAMTKGNPREAAIAMADTLLAAVAAPYDLDGHNFDIGTSVGIALAPEHGTDVDHLMKNADLALYKAKSQGRNTYRFFEDAMAAEAQTRRALEIDLRNALTQGEFELYYHPIVDIMTLEIAGVEALIRWRHPQRGMIAPDNFIPLAEETGLINPIGEWVLRQACRDAVSWPPHIKLAVNLSPAQFRKGDLVDIISRAVSEPGLSPERLELEITESVLMQGNDENVGTLHRLRSLGISIVLDDFGTGYSSLGYLRMFPFGKIKIDRSFVNELSRNADCAVIVSAIAGLGRSLHVNTVAEGVETADHLALVRAAGCNYAQGFLFGRPCPVGELDLTQLGEAKRKWQAA